MFKKLYYNKVISIRIFISVLVSVVSLIPFLGRAQNFQSPKEILNQHNQIILVVSKNWNSIQGRLWLFERKENQKKWDQVGKSFPVVLGKNGMAWGMNNDLNFFDMPIKKEGDYKSPVGIFPLRKIFGFKTILHGLKLSYTTIYEDTVCVDDPHSRYYNRIVTLRDKHRHDWKTAEKMHQYSEYQLGIVVDYNREAADQKKGSCVFIHQWTNAFIGTAGCTAMLRKNLKKVVYWLDRQKNPVLVQVPKNIYQKVKFRWGLPNID